MSDDKEKGLYAKYKIERLDGKPFDWGFVISSSDPLAGELLDGIADVYRRHGYHHLHADLAQKSIELSKKHGLDPLMHRNIKFVEYDRAYQDGPLPEHGVLYDKLSFDHPWPRRAVLVKNPELSINHPSNCIAEGTAFEQADGIFFKIHVWLTEDEAIRKKVAEYVLHGGEFRAYAKGQKIHGVARDSSLKSIYLEEWRGAFFPPES